MIANVIVNVLVVFFVVLLFLMPYSVMVIKESEESGDKKENGRKRDMFVCTVFGLCVTVGLMLFIVSYCL